MKKFQMLLLSFLFISSVMAQPHHKGPHGEKGSHVDRMTESLNLTIEQQETFEELNLDQMEVMQKYHSLLQIREAELSAAILNESSDDDVKEIVSEINDLRGKQFEARVLHRIELRGLLTDDQRIRFDQMSFDRKRGRHRRG